MEISGDYFGSLKTFFHSVNLENILKHVKAWLISSTDDEKDKTVFDLKQRYFYPRGSQKLATN